MEDFSDKVAFITGAASGIGLGMARAFAERGTHVMLADIDADGLGKAAASLGSDQGARVESVVCDVSDRESVNQARDATVDAFGAIHILCNNAGVSAIGPTAELPREEWDWVLGVNLMGVLHGLQAFVPLMKEHGEPGHVINTASVAGFLPLGGKQAPYKVTKFGVVALTEVLRDELAKTPLSASVLCPGPVRTNILRCNEHRPERFGPAPTGAGESRAEKFAAAVVESGLDPLLVGQLVVSAIEADRLYIFTAPQMRPMVEARHQMIGSDLEWAADHPLLKEASA